MPDSKNCDVTTSINLKSFLILDLSLDIHLRAICTFVKVGCGFVFYCVKNRNPSPTLLLLRPERIPSAVNGTVQYHPRSSVNQNIFNNFLEAKIPSQQPQPEHILRQAPGADRFSWKNPLNRTSVRQYKFVNKKPSLQPVNILFTPRILEYQYFLWKYYSPPSAGLQGPVPEPVEGRCRVCWRSKKQTLHYKLG